MVEERDIEVMGQSGKLARSGHVVPAWFGIAAGVVMNQDIASCFELASPAKDPAKIYFHIGYPALCDALD